jgi:hypothetical protein
LHSFQDKQLGEPSNSAHNKASAKEKTMLHFAKLTTMLFAVSAISTAAMATDGELAQLIFQRTDRSAALTQTRLASGEGILDLQGGAQHLTIAKLDDDGHPVAQCVGSLTEAEEFLGRSLGDARAIRHGMSATEFAQYSAMIRQAPAAPLAAGIAVLNNDGSGEGFNSNLARTAEGGNTGTTLGAQRLNVFNRAAQIWGQFLDSSVTTQIAATFDDLTPCTSAGGVLGGAGTTSLFQNFANAPLSNTYFPGALANKIRGGDGNPGAEIQAQFNSLVDTACLGVGTRFYYGLDNATPAGTVNLLVVVLHEIGHGLGSASYADEVSGAFANNVPDIWARFMYDAAQQKTWAQMTNSERASSAINSNLFWDSPSMRVAAPGYLTAGISANRVRLYAPTTLEQGSSVSHFDTTATPNLLMEPAINPGVPLTLDLTRQQLRDIGWFRDSNLDGVADTITDVQPSGVSVGLGTSTNITWANQGGFNKNVTVELSLDSGLTYSPITTPAQPAAGIVNTGSTGSFSWNVPNNIATTTARVRVREFDFADLVGASSANFSITTANTSPNVTLSATPTRQQGSAATTAIIATVSDAQTSAGSLTVSTINVPASLTLGTPVNSAGSVSLSVAASCTAPASSTFGLRVTDGGGLSTDQIITVNVSANTPPILTYAAANVVNGANVSVNPATGLSDNGTTTLSIVGFGSFSGTAAVTATGVVNLSNAQPTGTQTITVRALDNCSAATDTPLSVNVGPLNTAPTFVANTAITRTQGEQNATAVALGTASDAQTAAGSLLVTQIGGGTASGVTLSNLLNSAGNISGQISADCNATSGTLRIQISDGALSTVSAITVSIINNVPPIFGTYASQVLAPGASISVIPSAPPSDNGPIQSTNAQIDPSGFTGTFNLVAATGVVNLNNVGPASNFTVTLFATDSCGAVGSRNFTLRIDADRVFGDGFE